MPRRSSISRLPEEIRKMISSLFDQGRTIDEIMINLRQLEVGVSRSAVGRYLKKQAIVSEQIRRSRSLAEAVAKEFGGREASDVARTNIELLHTLLMRVMIGDPDSDEEVVLDPKEAMFAATALEKLLKASKLDVDREVKVREEERLLAKQKAADAAVRIGKKEGLTAETVNKIKAEILGVSL